MRERYGFPYYSASRRDLVRLISSVAKARPGIAIEEGVDVSAIETTPSSVKIRANGRQFIGRWLVGADGSNSWVRKSLFADKPSPAPRFEAWRTLVPSDSVLAGVCEDLCTQLWLGPHAHVVHYSIAGGSSINVVAVLKRSSTQLEQGKRTRERAELLERLGGWHKSVRQLLASIPDHEVEVWPLVHRPPPRCWNQGRTILIGDACSTILPFFAQGAAKAIEDAASLARCVDQSDHPEPAFRKFQSMRASRVGQFGRQARLLAIAYHAGPPVAWIRDLGSACMARRVADWTFAHDAPSGQSVPLDQTETQTG